VEEGERTRAQAITTAKPIFGQKNLPERHDTICRPILESKIFEIHDIDTRRE
jgi:hypothetical protein